MEQVFNLIFNGFAYIYDILNKFTFSAYGFSFSMWDFFVSMFILSLIVPLVTPPALFLGANLFEKVSERVRNKKNNDDWDD